MKIAHESPISIFKEVQKRTDYDYCLVHLMDENEKYRNYFLEASKKGREIILDNSIFELGKAYDPEKFAMWVVKLQPTWYMLPDVLEDCSATIQNVIAYSTWDLPGKKIGVVQGKSADEIIQCYRNIEPYVDKIAISFDYSFFVNEEQYGKLPNKYHHFMYARDNLLHQMLSMGIINRKKPHHLLGCSLPQEFSSYHSYSWIDSVDTSNPVVAGIKEMKYDGREGLQDKPSQKLHELISYKPTQKQKKIINYNIEAFKNICESL